MRRLVWPLLLIGLLPPADALSAPQADDEELSESVSSALADRGFDEVRVRASNGTVFLSGRVRSAREKILAIQAAFTNPDVQAVESELGVEIGVTLSLEEDVWFALMDAGADRGIEEVIVDDHVARVRGRVADEAARDRVVSVIRDVAGIEAVTSSLLVETYRTPPTTTSLEVTEAPATEPPREPEPPPATAEPDPAPLPEGTAPKETGVAAEPSGPPPTETKVTPEPAPPTETTPPPEPAPPTETTPPPEPAPPAAPPSPPARDARDLARDLTAAILSSPGYTVFDHVQFALDGASVTLVGSVTSQEKKDGFDQTVRAVSGVREVDNELRVLSSSPEDERLRKRLFDRIYEDPSFESYAELSNPPIHIIVDSKFVTLTGIVDTEIQRLAAEAIVHTTFGVRSVRNQLRLRN